MEEDGMKDWTIEYEKMVRDSKAAEKNEHKVNPRKKVPSNYWKPVRKVNPLDVWLPRVIGVLGALAFAGIALLMMVMVYQRYAEVLKASMLMFGVCGAIAFLVYALLLGAGNKGGGWFFIWWS
jgi:hypothetical protein